MDFLIIDKVVGEARKSGNKVELIVTLSWILVVAETLI
jgi:hypothetical protein